MIAWVRMPKVTEEGWIGMFCSPRVVEAAGGHVYFRLHPNVRQAYSRKAADVCEIGKDGYMVVVDLEDGEELEIGGYGSFGKAIRSVRTEAGYIPALPEHI